MEENNDYFEFFEDNKIWDELTQENSEIGHDVFFSIETLEFVWNSEKAKATYDTRKIKFEDAAFVFTREDTYYKDDYEHSVNEQRFKATGFDKQFNLLLVCYCTKENDLIRIITAWEATTKEEREWRDNI